MEVVEVRYLTERIEFAQLVQAAQGGSCATRIFTTSAAQLEIAQQAIGQAAQMLRRDPAQVLTEAEAEDQLYYLRRSALDVLPLSPLQARRASVHGKDERGTT